MQQHVIKRQTFEITIPDSAQAQTVHSELSRINRQRFAPLLDRLCSELSAPDRLHRIDRLEIDLGAIDWASFEQELVSRTSEALRQALTNEITDLEHAGQADGLLPQARSQLELLSLYLRTGSLPWWADAGRPDIIEDALRLLIETAPAALRRLFSEVDRAEAQARRLILAGSDEILAQAATTTATESDESAAMEVTALLRILAQTRLAPSNLVRQHFWQSIFSLLSQAVGSADRPTFPVRVILMRLAARLGIPLAPLLDEMEIALNQDTALSEVSKRGLQTHLSALRRSLESDASGSMYAEHSAKPSGSDDRDNRSHQDLSARLEALMNARSERPLSAQEQALLAELQTATDENVDRIETDDVLDPSFGEADEFYIQNAGLVILWPFLGRFFETVALAAENQFKDEATQHRAAGILQYLVHPEQTFSEYLLPLNKVLCGMALETVFEFGDPLTDTEIAHCTTLLEAVIAQATILNEMSIDGLRGSFLLRQGVLGWRDGAWLLRVERESYDVVLDRFPWNWQWVKTPWMEMPLRVEW